LDTVKENINPEWTPSTIQENPTFMDAFGVFFTAVTGIVAGANLSGDLKDPSLAIPKGTLLAIAGTYITYMYFGLQTSFVFHKRASGISEEFRFFNKRGDFVDENGNFLVKDLLYGALNGSSLAKPYIELPKWTDCSDESAGYRDYLKGTAFPYLDQKLNTSYSDVYDKWNTNNEEHGKCMFGSGHNQMTMTYISYTGWLRYAGGFSASLSSAIASMVGAPRILQAVGKDGIYPGSSPRDSMPTTTPGEATSWSTSSPWASS